MMVSRKDIHGSQTRQPCRSSETPIAFFCRRALDTSQTNKVMTHAGDPLSANQP